MVQRGFIVSCVVGVAALVGLGAVFVSNASPYATIAEAKQTTGTTMHVAGEMKKDSLRQDLARREATFTITENGQTLDVLYRGKPQPNLSMATKVVVIGKMEGQQFVAEDMLLKCPSKYESEKGAGGTRAN